MDLYLEKLVVENYKAFDQRQEIPFQPDITFVIGTNASGKTSLVEILWLLSSLARGFGEQHVQRCFSPLSEEGFLGCLSWRDEQRPMAFEIHARSDEGLIYRLSLKYDRRTGSPQVVEEQLKTEKGIAAVLKPQDRAWKFSGLKQLYSGSDTLAAPLILSQRGEWILKDHVEQHRKLKPLLSFLQWVQCWFVLRPNVLEAGRRVETKNVAKHRELAEDGSNFMSVLFNWKNNPEQSGEWTWIREQTQMLLEDLGMQDLEWDVTLRSRGEQALCRLEIWKKQTARVERDGRGVTIADAHIPFHQKGYDLAFGPDGLKQWFILLTTLAHPHFTLIVIEEPEAHLDPRMVDLLANAFQSLKKQPFQPSPRQILVTTHSPMLAGEWPPKHVLALRGGKVVPLPASLSESLQEKRIDLLEAWMLDMVDDLVE